MNKIILKDLDLKIFTEQDASDYCQLNGLNIKNIPELYLYNNRLTDISGIKIFKNLEKLFLDNNKIKDISALKDLIKLKMLDIKSNNIKDISVVQYLKKLEYLNIKFLRLESNQIQYINNLKNLKELICSYNGFKNKSVLKQLNKNIKYY